ncbi:MAG: DUF423 domain-containing protein [Gammaproteobacteria bacterium]|nr:DUF423 domain-containing protein [Gammaproteobacteria bacterium]
MTPTAKLFLILGGINAALAVLLGAFGAHALKARLSLEMIAVYQTGVHYHFFHALGLLVVGVVATQIPMSVFLKWSGWLMLMGIVLFCGSLYILSIGDLPWLGAITPVGGVSFIVAWILFVVAVAKSS